MQYVIDTFSHNININNEIIITSQQPRVHDKFTFLAVARYITSQKPKEKYCHLNMYILSFVFFLLLSPFSAHRKSLKCYLLYKIISSIFLLNFNECE